MAKSKIVTETDVPEPTPVPAEAIITAPAEQVSEAAAPEVIPAPADEQPANHLGVWPTAFGQRVRGIAFEGIGTVTRYDDITCIVDVEGQDYIVARSELGVVEAD